MFLLYSILMIISFCFSSFLFFFLFSLLPLVFFVFLSMSSLSSFLVFSSLFFEETSFFMLITLLLVIYFSLLFSPLYSSFSLFLLCSINLACLVVFSTCNIFFLYLFYELSLIPIILIIMVWGSYPERSLSSLMLLLYTSVFTLPFIFSLFVFYSNIFSFSIYSSDIFMNLGSFSFPCFISFSFLFVFIVKLPVYGLHYWLPMAHVEAPTFGSMLLAGVLLNLGGVGLLRSAVFISTEIITFSLLGYFFFFLVYVPLVCSFQSDFNRLVAYSSVSHIIVIPILFLCLTPISNVGIIITMLFHGLSSPLLFSLVGTSYRLFGTRLIILIRGLVATTPLLAFLMLFAFVFTLCIPPFPSFVSEVLFFLCSFLLWSFSLVLLVIFSVLSLVYNLSWFSSSLFLSPSSLCSYSFFPVYYSVFMPMFFMCFTGLLLVPFIALF